MSSFEIRPSQRLLSLPPYLFVEIDKEKRLAKKLGRDIIDLGIGDPDQPTPEFIIEAFKQAVDDSENHHYALDSGLYSLREQIARWYEERFKIKLNPVDEIYPLIGSKEGLAHLPLGLINPGDKVLIPDPAYPAYRAAANFAGAKIEVMPLLEKNNFLPDLRRIPRAKLAFFNYPNNPTAVVADKSFYKGLISVAIRNSMIVAADFAYSELYYDNQQPASFLQIDGAKEVGVEFHSLSKTYNMTGWRIGWVCGNKDVINILARLKSNIDSGVFQAIQVAAIVALNNVISFPAQMRRLYQERRDIFVNGLKEIGWDLRTPAATFYIWAPIPTKETSIKFAKRVLDQADIVCTPGVGFGKYGEGYVRFALTVPKERLTEAVRRIKKII
jgi:LL-diaminopimelate aminotransferase